MDAVADIKDRLAIEDVVAEYVQLKRAGRNFKGLSPFANEKSPSFVVSPEKQIWHDFSSGKGGDVFGFIMEVEGLDFKGALELLSRKAGVDLTQYKTGGTGVDNSKTKERMHAVLETAARFYQVQLTKNMSALEYTRKKRAFSKETILQFRLGYSPTGGKELLSYLLGKSYTLDEIKKAGLVSERSAGTSDMFRGRLMVPLCDQQGAVVGFTARQLDSDPNAPKYINTPATLLYDKGRQAYGLHLAKESIRKLGFVVIVEGNLDVIASHQVGVTNVVATAGTAMTAQHLKALKRFTSDIRLCFDQDSAGQNAAERAIDLANDVGVTLQMITIPAGKDPDELIQKDVSAWQQAINKPQYVIDWLMDRYESQLDITSAVGKRKFTDVVLRLVRRLKDPVELDHYIGVLAKKIDISNEALRQKLNQTEVAPVRRLKALKNEVELASELRDQKIMGQHLLAITLRFPELRQILSGLPKDVFVEKSAQDLSDFLQENLDYELTDEPSSLNSLRNIADYVKMLLLLSEELYQTTEESELSYQTEHLVSRLVTEYIKNKKRQLIESLSSSDDSDTAKTLIKVKELDELSKVYRLHS
ncbi:MAG: DNA primase [bacterium]